MNCHRCNKICKSKAGLTNHLKNCIQSIQSIQKKNNIKKSKCFQCKNLYNDNGHTVCDKCRMNNVMNNQKNIFNLRTH